MFAGPKAINVLAPFPFLGREEDLRLEAWFTPFDGTVALWERELPGWVTAALRRGPRPVVQPDAFALRADEQRVLQELTRGIVEREVSWRRSCAQPRIEAGEDSDGGRAEETEADTELEALLLVRPQLLHYAVRGQVRTALTALVVEREGRLGDMAAVRYQVEHDLADAGEMFEALISEAEQDAAPLWAITLDLATATATEKLLARLPTAGLGSSGDNGTWTFDAADDFIERIRGSEFTRDVEGIIVVAANGYEDSAHPDAPWALSVTRSEGVFCTACRNDSAHSQHRALLTVLGSTLRSA
ncbi:hypothetical protein [Streptomyces sp. NPDC050988]|uniref:hypothetical protein n=1 Tax=Streptomyces sp. NPDC050988 TaxID=3365637 RepID=UPI0037BD32D3